MNIVFKTLLTILAFSFQSRADEINDYLKSAMQRQHIPGLSIAIMKNEETTKIGAYGDASIELHVPATTNTVFELASLTKPFVATTVMLLAQDQKLGLDDPISRYIDKTPAEWRSITWRDTGQVRVRQK
jgi:CubicO group peptidase (beta-lactamase class C family)